MRALVIGASGKMGALLMELLKRDTSVDDVYGYDKVAKPELKIFSDFSTVPEVDVIIDFSTPHLLDILTTYALHKGIPLVIATTGYSEQQKIKIQEVSLHIPVFYSANYAFGVAILSEVLKRISKQLEADFDIEIVEKHHHHKVDAPSGTSLHLAETINSQLLNPKKIVNGHQGKRDASELAIHAVRGGSLVGEHQVIFAGADEVIELTHYAQSKAIFAHGAIKAAKFIQKQNPGFYTMTDLFKENN